MTKTSIIQVNDGITVYILNKFKCFAKLNPSEIPAKGYFNWIQTSIENKLECKILMVNYDELLNVVEFYIL